MEAARGRSPAALPLPQRAQDGRRAPPATTLAQRAGDGRPGSRTDSRSPRSSGRPAPRSAAAAAAPGTSWRGRQPGGRQPAGDHSEAEAVSIGGGGRQPGGHSARSTSCCPRRPSTPPLMPPQRRRVSPFPRGDDGRGGCPRGAGGESPLRRACRGAVSGGPASWGCSPRQGLGPSEIRQCWMLPARVRTLPPRLLTRGLLETTRCGMRSMGSQRRPPRRMQGLLKTRRCRTRPVRVPGLCLLRRCTLSWSRPAFPRRSRRLLWVSRSPRLWPSLERVVLRGIQRRSRPVWSTGLSRAVLKPLLLTQRAGSLRPRWPR